jgi:Radical SAM superfamily
MPGRRRQDSLVSPRIVLINPPVVRPCEPPAGLAGLAGALKQCGIAHRLIDINLEAILHKLESPELLPDHADTWTKRALKNRMQHLAFLKSSEGYRDIDRYRRAVADINRILEWSSRPFNVTAGLANYHDQTLSPQKSSDLLIAAGRPASNSFYPYFHRRLSRIIEQESPAAIGISLNYLSQALSTFAMAGFIKRTYPALKIIIGGGLVTSWMRGPDWQSPFGGLIDDMIAGPGEIPLLQSLGITALPSAMGPDFDQLNSHDYLSPGAVLPFVTATGCYWRRCTFCPEKAEENSYRPLAATDALASLQRLSRTMQPSLIHFLDNALSPTFLSALVKDPPGIPWYGFARITDHLANPEFCRALKDSGCVMLKLGLESGDQSVLDHLEKGIDLETAAAALKTLKQAGIGTYVYLLFGTPSETQVKGRRTLDFTVQHSDCIDFLNLAIFNLPAGTPDAAALDTEDFYEGDLSLYWDFRHPEGWSRMKVRRFLDKEFRRHPAIAPIVRRDPPFFTSNHAPFFLLHGGVRAANNRNRR